MDNLAREKCTRFDREAVYPANRSILEYWLSLRRDDALPLRTDFDLRHVPQSLSKLSLMQVWPKEHLVCRLSGTAVVRMIGRDLTGCDIIANTAPEFRRERMARYVNCMDGFIHRSVRTLQGASGDPGPQRMSYSSLRRYSRRRLSAGPAGGRLVRCARRSARIGRECVRRTRALRISGHLKHETACWMVFGTEGLDCVSRLLAEFFMRKGSSGVAVAVLALCLTGCGSGQPKHREPPEPPKHPATAMLLPYAAPDGTLTRAQMEAGLHRDFNKADLNHNGCLDDKEVRAINQQRWTQDASTASPLIDFKQNGCFDFDEYAATRVPCSISSIVRARAS